ncbi:MAG: SRPBCC domain-containing protein [Pseudomonadota bacterium]
MTGVSEKTTVQETGAQETDVQETDVKAFETSRDYAHPPELMFRLFTEPEHLARWFGPVGFTVEEARTDLKPGGAWRIVMRSPEGNQHRVTGVYEEVSPPVRVVFSWAWESEDGSLGHVSRVIIAFASTDSGCRMSLRHENLADDEARAGHGRGWTSSLESIDAYLETL